MKKLFDLATSSSYKDFFLVPGGTHNNTFEVAGIQYYHVHTHIYTHTYREFPNSYCLDSYFFILSRFILSQLILASDFTKKYEGDLGLGGAIILKNKNRAIFGWADMI